jgi:hypothetical protein
MPGPADRFALVVEEQIEHLRARENAGAAAPIVAHACDAAVRFVELDGVAARAFDETLDRHDTFIFPRRVAIETTRTVLPRILIWQRPGDRTANRAEAMDWYLIGFTVAASWVALLVAGDLAALLNVPAKTQAVARNAAFFFWVAMAISLGVAVAGSHHAKPCTTKGAPR